MGIKAPPSSLAAAAPAKPSSTAAPTYPDTSGSSSLASATTPPKVEYPTTAASFNAPGSAAQNQSMVPRSPLSTARNPLAASQSPLPTARNPLMASKSPLMAPQKGRYGEANSPTGGFKNPIYNTRANSAPFQKTPLVQNPYRASVPAIPQSSGSLATGTGGSPYPVQNNVGTDSRYRAAVASSTNRASASTYSSDPNSRYYGTAAARATAPATAPATATAPGSTTLPRVVGGYPSTSASSPAVTTARVPASRYPTVSSPINVAVPAANANPPAPNYPVTSPAATTPPSASYQPGANGYQPGNNGYTPGNTGYQPATRSTAPIQSGSQPVGKGEAPPFRPGSTGNVNDYPWAPGSASPSRSPLPSGAYPNTQAASPVKTSINTSNVMPVGFNQGTLQR